MSRVRVQIMNQFHRKSHEYKAIKRYWKLIQQDSRKLSDKRFYRPTFRMHLTNKEILDKILSYSEDLKHHYQIYQLYQLLLFHFQNKEPMTFKNRLRSLTSKQLVCLLEFSLENAVSSAITVQK
ncbi:degenerate transposase (orf2) [Streptococcus pneumoniae]|nr:degenerate transposase (orf2) [Streptococcus pneumoniae]